MYRLINFLKQNNIPAPVFIGNIVSRIPFSLRPGVGKIYSQKKTQIAQYDLLSINERKKLIFNSFYTIFKHAYTNIPFFNDLYKYKHKINLKDINSFEDIKNVPILNKEFLKSVPLEERSYKVSNRILVNTGGSSGKPFSFYMDPKRYGNEWAHLHQVWSKYNYKPNKIMLKFDGRCSNKNAIEYDFIRNIFNVNLNIEFKEITKNLSEIISFNKVEYLWGYPSAIFEFLNYCNSENKALLIKLKDSLKCAFFASEFPVPSQRKFIENVIGIPTLSFYGHTETCIMACESEKYIFRPYQTYGFAGQ